MEITGRSMAAHAQAVVDAVEADKVLRMLPLKYPEQVSLPGPMPTADQVRIFRVTPVVISVLDYSKGFGHTDLVTGYAVLAGLATAFAGTAANVPCFHETTIKMMHATSWWQDAVGALLCVGCLGARW